MDKKVFTFKYDPKITLEGMFTDFWKATRGELRSVKPHEISSPHLETLLSSINKNQQEIFNLLVREKPNSLIELAKMLNRDYNSVAKDAEVLESMGIIELRKEKQEVRLVALYERIVFDLGYCEALRRNLILEIEAVNDFLEHRQEGSLFPLVAHGVLVSQDLKNI